MENKVHELNCVQCKTKLLVKTCCNYDNNDYKLVFCPTCHTPIREIRTDNEFLVEKISYTNN